MTLTCDFRPSPAAARCAAPAVWELSTLAAAPPIAGVPTLPAPRHDVRGHACRRHVDALRDALHPYAVVAVSVAQGPDAPSGTR